MDENWQDPPKKPRKPRKAPAVSQPLAFEPHEQETILQFLYYAILENDAVLDGMNKVVKRAHGDEMTQGMYRFRKQLEGWLNLQCQRVGQRRKWRRKVNGVLVHDYGIDTSTQPS